MSKVKPTSTLPDSGSRTQFSTGAVRDAMEGKGWPSSIPPCFIMSVAKRFEDGGKKYAKDNWLKGIPYSRFVDAIIRHTLKAAMGYTDEDHLGAIGWNAGAWQETMRRVDLGILPAELNDLSYWCTEDPVEFEEFRRKKERQLKRGLRRRAPAGRRRTSR